EFIMYISTRRAGPKKEHAMEHDDDDLEAHTPIDQREEGDIKFRFNKHQRTNRKKSITREEWVDVFTGPLYSVHDCGLAVQHKVDQGHFHLDLTEMQLYADAEKVMVKSEDARRETFKAEQGPAVDFGSCDFLDAKKAIANPLKNAPDLSELEDRKTAKDYELFKNYNANEKNRSEQFTIQTLRADLRRAIATISHLKKEFRQEKAENHKFHDSVTQNSDELWNTVRGLSELLNTTGTLPSPVPTTPRPHSQPHPRPPRPLPDNEINDEPETVRDSDFAGFPVTNLSSEILNNYIRLWLFGDEADILW
ncbi:hypothetical protein CYMTET_56545, partial [Cymbomonas tetramitiformis]